MRKQFSLLTLFIALCIFSAHASSLPVFGNINLNKLPADEGVKIKLIIAGKSYDVVTYNLNFQASDKSTPNTEAVKTTFPYMNSANNLNITIRTSKIDQELLDWILSADGAAKEGQILIVDNDSGKNLKTLSFTELKPANFNESYYNSGMSGTSIQPTVSFGLHFKKVNIKL